MNDTLVRSWSAAWSWPPLAVGDSSFWLPPPNSTTSPVIDGLFNFLLLLSAVFFGLIVSLMLIFVIKYRRRPGVEAVKTATHSTALELTWSLIPFLLVLIIFYWGFIGYMEMRLSPRNAYDIKVRATQWAWLFIYPGGYSDKDLHVPVDEPVRLVMQSEDVIHGLSIPSLRVKMDVVPGRYTYTWFHALKPGIFDLYCTEYCGDKHSGMLADVVVHKPGEFRTWLAEAEAIQANLSPVDSGARLYENQRCDSCHSIDGSAKDGPSFKGIWGETHQFRDGSSQVVDENYVRESILNPSAKIRQGFGDRMTPYQGRLTDQQIDHLIEFIKSLK